MSIKSSLNKVFNIRVFIYLFIFVIITKIECWPVFKQDPLIVKSIKKFYSQLYIFLLLTEINNIIQIKYQVVVHLSNKKMINLIDIFYIY